MAIDINLNVNPADDGNPYNDYNKKEAQAHIDKLINEQISDEQLEAFLESKRDQAAADNAKFVQEQQEAMEEALQKFAEEQKSKQGYDDLLSAPDITPEQSSQLKFNTDTGTGDLVFQQRIENLDRTINSKEFRNAAVQLNPYFDTLKNKASRLENPDDLMPLVDKENERQLANINDIETTMFNAIDMLFAQTQMKMRSLEASMEEGSSLTEDPRYNELLNFQSQLNSMRDNVSSYIGESVDKLQTESTKFAIAGFDEGDTERKIAEGMKEQKRVEKLVSDFNKEFDSYIDKQKEEVAKGYAFSMAQGYLNSNRDATMQNARRVYANAFKDFQDNVPVSKHGLSDEEIEAIFSATGGDYSKVNFGNAPKINVPGKFQPGNKPPLPPSYLNPANNNVSSLQGNGGGGSGKIPIHMIMSEVTSAIIEPMMAIRAALIGFAVPDLKNYMKATRPERINPNEYIESIGEKAGNAATAVGRTTGSAIGFALGGLPGAFAGSRIGETIADIIPIEEFAQMVSYLYQIADNTSRQAMAFSPELMQANVDRQLAFLEENIAVGESVGAELAELYDAGTQFQINFYREALEIVRPLLPLMTQVVGLLTIISSAISAQISGILEYLRSGSWMSAFAAFATNLANLNRPKPTNNVQNQMDQLDDNVPFLP
jgi:hypothetical protein